VASCSECGDEPSGSCATELVNNQRLSTTGYNYFRVHEETMLEQAL
jgi:hypothetical protein